MNNETELIDEIVRVEKEISVLEEDARKDKLYDEFILADHAVRKARGDGRR